MHCYALPPHRTENTLTAGHKHLLRLKESAHKNLKAGNQHDLCHSIEVLNLMDVAELVILAVIERKESRDQARRMDYPFANPALRKLLVIILMTASLFSDGRSPEGYLNEHQRRRC
jgi:succinate dehydrogenase/fumarate reductase flavoprotein subunit